MLKEEKQSKKEEKENNGNDKKITLTFIINGEATQVSTNVKAPLKSAVEKALEESENTGRPLSDWQVKFNGTILDMNEKVENLPIADGSELFLSLKTGEGGSF
ncbi:MAG: DUF2604 domain-containing protein [Bacteroidia bacterium]|jgi:hypothetical protein|nr:DUF2604 domain-containing protein [Bacteroidia bacterium]